MWKKYFKIIGIKPGVIIYPRPFGRIDFSSDNLDINLLKRLVEDDRNLPYLVMTDEGIDHFYDDTPDDDNKNDIKGNEEPGKEYTAKELVSLIKKSKTTEEAYLYLNRGHNFVSVEKAYAKRFKELNQGS